MKKYFPIQTKTACRNKWAWSTIFLTDGVTSSCHRASPANLNKDNFFNFHNLPNKLEDRKKMLLGEWPGNGCEYCRDIELAGGSSDRQFQLTIPNNYPEELDIDASAVKVTPTTLEIFFKNTCNLLCVYCSEKYSSSIQKENEKYGYIDIKDERNILNHDKYEELSPLIWQWLTNNYHKLKRIHVLGGEPLIQDDFIKLLDFFHTHPNPEIELIVVSNLNIKEKNLKQYFSKVQDLIKLRKIKRVEVQASVDSWGVGQEYIRSGFKLDLFERNLIYLLKIPSIRLSILSTVTSLSILEMPILAQKMKEWKKIRKIQWYIHSVLPHGTSVYDPKIFDYKIFSNSLNQVVDSLDNQDYDDAVTKDMLLGIIDYLKDGTNQKDKQIELITSLNKIDLRRKYNWQLTFPWLKNVVQQNSI